MSRERLPVERTGVTRKMVLGGTEGYVTTGLYEDGRLGEVFFQGFGKEGSFVRVLLGVWGTTLSIALQSGTPVDDLLSKYIGVREEPYETGEREIPVALSIPDYVGCWLALRYGSDDLRAQTAEQLAKRRRPTEPLASLELP